MEKTKTPFLIVKYVIKYTYLTLMGFQFCIDDFIPFVYIYKVKFWVNELQKMEPSCCIYICATKLDLINGSNKEQILNNASCKV